MNISLFFIRKCPILKIEFFVTVQDGASSCPAKPDKKHRRFLRCEIWQENPRASKLDTNFSARSPAVLNSYKSIRKG